MFKKVEKNMSMFSNDRKNIKDPYQIFRLENYNVYNGKHTWWNYQEIIGELKEVAIETAQKATENMTEKTKSKNRDSVYFEIISSDQICL